MRPAYNENTSEANGIYNAQLIVANMYERTVQELLDEAASRGIVPDGGNGAVSGPPAVAVNGLDNTQIVQGSSVQVSGGAIAADGTDISNQLQWHVNGQGPVATGSNVNIPLDEPGTAIITARARDPQEPDLEGFDSLQNLVIPPPNVATPSQPAKFSAGQTVSRGTPPELAVIATVEWDSVLGFYRYTMEGHPFVFWQESLLSAGIIAHEAPSVSFPRTDLPEVAEITLPASNIGDPTEVFGYIRDQNGTILGLSPITELLPDPDPRNFTILHWRFTLPVTNTQHEVRVTLRDVHNGLQWIDNTLLFFK